MKQKNLGLKWWTLSSLKLWHENNEIRGSSVCFYALTWPVGCVPMAGSLPDLQTCDKSWPIWCLTVQLGSGPACKMNGDDGVLVVSCYFLLLLSLCKREKHSAADTCLNMAPAGWRAHTHTHTHTHSVKCAGINGKLTLPQSQCQADLCRRLLPSLTVTPTCIFTIFCHIYHLLTGPGFILQLPFSSLPPHHPPSTQLPVSFLLAAHLNVTSPAAAAELLCNAELFLAGLGQAGAWYRWRGWWLCQGSPHHSSPLQTLHTPASLA